MKILMNFAEHNIGYEDGPSNSGHFFENYNISVRQKPFCEIFLKSIPTHSQALYYFDTKVYKTSIK